MDSNTPPGREERRHAGRLRAKHYLPPPLRHGPLLPPLPVLHAPGGGPQTRSRRYLLGGGAGGNRPGRRGLRGPEGPPHRRGTPGPPGDSGHMPGRRRHSRGGGAVPHHQRPGPSPAGGAPPGGGRGPAERQPGHPPTGPLRLHDPGGPFGGGLPGPGGRGGGGLHRNEAERGADEVLQRGRDSRFCQPGPAISHRGPLY